MQTTPVNYTRHISSGGCLLSTSHPHTRRRSTPVQSNCAVGSHDAELFKRALASCTVWEYPHLKLVLVQSVPAEQTDTSSLPIPFIFFRGDSRWHCCNDQTRHLSPPSNHPFVMGSIQPHLGYYGNAVKQHHGERQGENNCLWHSKSAHHSLIGCSTMSSYCVFDMLRQELIL